MSIAAASSTAGALGGNAAQIAQLERQLATFQKQLQTDETSGGGVTSTAATQLVATEIALVEAEIAALSQTNAALAGVPSASAAGSRVGTQLDVTA